MARFPGPDRGGRGGNRRVSRRKAGEGEVLASLKHELASTREQLQSIIEGQEATNEELETAQEELQSSNEELTTLNDELQNRNAELGQLADDLGNLLVGVDIPIVILGADRRIRRFTPAAEQLLNLIPTDVGRPIGDIRPNIDVPELDRLISEVIDKHSFGRTRSTGQRWPLVLPSNEAAQECGEQDRRGADGAHGHRCDEARSGTGPIVP